MNKKNILILLAAIFVSSVFAGDFDDKGVITGWKFAPVQIDVGLVNEKKLVDETSHTFFSFGLFILQQKSAVLSVALIANTLQNNYGLQLPLFMGAVTDINYGISAGLENYSKKCYGIQLGVINHSFAGEPIEKSNERVQFLGANIADTLFLGLVNFSNEIQIGLANFSKGAIFQIGLLNYNPQSYIPWMPIVNWNMGRGENK
ncbi:MAG: hypothetical protein J6W00_06510 [Lentisphaeria bacterium]|nr:hypothetical protein [Lentisphaeria bacterium]